MDTLQISGKTYISGTRAAKEHGYTADYIGQLIRAGKLKGQKVGRAWYVSEESLQEYLAKEVKGFVSQGDTHTKESEPAVRTEEVLPEIPEMHEEKGEEKKEVQEEKSEVSAQKEEIKSSETSAVEKIEQHPPMPAQPVEAVKVFQKPAPISTSTRHHIAREIPSISVREHILLTYLKDEEKPLRPEREEKIPIHVMPALARELPPESAAPQPPQRTTSRKTSRGRSGNPWKRAAGILFLGVLAFVCTAAAAAFIPAVITFP